MDEQQRTQFIPRNVINNSRILGFKKRNLIEGVVWVAVFALFVNLIPFVLKVKIIIIVSIGLVLLIINGFGIRGNALSATIVSFIRYRYYTNKFSYRRLNNVTENEKPIIDPNTRKVRTITENRSVRFVKKFLGED